VRQTAHALLQRANFLTIHAKNGRQRLLRFIAPIMPVQQVQGEFVEVETGKGSGALDRRPKLAEALARRARRRPP
jgi:hypothetical protein